MTLVYIAIIGCVILYVRLLSLDTKKLFVGNVSLQLPIDKLSLVRNDLTITFWKPIGKHELHAFIIGDKFGDEQDVYLGKFSNEIASKLLSAISLGGPNHGIVTERTDKGRLIIFYPNYTTQGPKSVFGFLKKNDLSHIEKNFATEFNLKPAKVDIGSSVYEVGSIPKSVEKLKYEKQNEKFKVWAEKLALWWEESNENNKNEIYSGLLDIDENIIVAYSYTYRRVTGDESMTPAKIREIKSMRIGSK